MKKLFFKSITFKILVLILVISLVENFLLIFMSDKLALSALENQIDEYSSKNTALYAQDIGNWLNERMNEIKIYADCPVVKTMDWDLTEPYLKSEISDKLDIYDFFMVADKSGSYNSTIRRNSSNARDRAYFREALKGKTVVSDPIVSRTNKNAVAVIATPVRDAGGDIVGVMGGAVNLIKLSNMIKDFKYDHPGSYAYIVDKNGLVIAHPHTGLILNENISRASSIISREIVAASNNIRSRDLGKVQYFFNGVESFNYFHQIPNTNGWKIVVRIPLDYWLRPVYEARLRLMLISSVIVLLSAILSAVVAKSISDPIIRLKNVFVQAAAGDLSVRSRIESEDEIGQAARSFNLMIERISHLTYYDALTGLPNRFLFRNHLESLLKEIGEKGFKLAVMIMDIDRFGNINNTLGHDVGDKLLVNLAAKITGCLSADEMLARIGEDKFILLLRHQSEQKEILDKARSILELIKQPLIIDDYRLYVTAGIGISFYPEDGSSCDALSKNAYSAMQRAKKIGRDNFQLYDATASYNLMEQLYLDNSMHRALESNEFLLHYQPQVEAVSGKIIGCEALLRWRHPELGMISPGKFIPIAEANGLIVPIGEWVLQTACSRAKKWQEAGHASFYVSVNISAIQLLQENFVSMVVRILEETGLAPQYLELEITESIAMENTEYIPAILASLNNIGIRIALDDFGTGYSSLNYLKNFAITTLKIDQSFIRDLTVNPKDAAIVSTILAIGHNLDLLVTAEGVEAHEQYDILRKEKCDIIQGFLFGRPIPVAEFEKLLGI